MNKLLFFFILLLLHTSLHAQDEIKLYQQIYRTSDSLKKAGSIQKMDTSVYALAKKLDKQQPSNFFTETGELLAAYKFNEASFIFYLGRMRYAYFNSVNPNYKPDGDGALAASFSYIFGEPINAYLKTDVDNFISILKRVNQYYKNNEFIFYTGKTDSEKFNTQIIKCQSLLTDLESQKALYTEQWNTERQEFQKRLNELLQESK